MQLRRLVRQAGCMSSRRVLLARRLGCAASRVEREQRAQSDLAQRPAGRDRAQHAGAGRLDRLELPRRLARRSAGRSGHGARAGTHDVPRHEESVDQPNSARSRPRSAATSTPQTSEYDDPVPVHGAGRRSRRGAAHRVRSHARRARPAVAVAERTRRDRTRGRARRSAAGQRFLRRRASDRVQGHGRTNTPASARKRRSTR